MYYHKMNTLTEYGCMGICAMKIISIQLMKMNMEEDLQVKC